MADIRRAPYKEKYVKDLTAADFKVTLSGAVAGAREEGFLLADGSGEVFVNVSKMENFMPFKENEIVKIFGRIMPYESGLEVQAEIVKSLAGVDMGSLKRIRDLLMQ